MSIPNNNELDICPYMFEPEYSPMDVNKEHDVGEVSSSRADKPADEWCLCANCTQMPSSIECKCCQEDDKFTFRCQEDQESFQCITQHPGFKEVALSVHNLRTVYFHYVQEFGHMENMNINLRYRFTAYRHTTRWIHGYLGKKNRVVLPSCVINAIRDKFPDDQYHGFKLPSLIYTNIKLHDNAARMDNIMEEFRLKLVERPIDEKKNNKCESECKLESLMIEPKEVNKI